MKNILVVEDNEMTIEIYKIIFKKYLKNVKAEYVTDAEKAIERVTKNNFDLLIADFNLGHKTINGMDIARLTYPLGKPIIIVSGHKIIPKLILWFKYIDMFNKVMFINKPFRCKTLIKGINQQLDIPCTPLNEMFNKITACF